MFNEKTWKWREDVREDIMHIWRRLNQHEEEIKKLKTKIRNLENLEDERE